MKLTIGHITGVSSAMRPNSAAVIVECRMSEREMFDALLQFCEHITDATFAEWVRYINDDSQGNADRCTRCGRAVGTRPPCSYR